jgi:hypothetical protein
VDAVLKPSASGDLTGFVLTQNQDNVQVLWQVSSAGNGTKRAINVDVANARQLVAVGEQLLLVHGGDSKEISVVDFSSAGVVLRSTGIAGLPADALVKPSGPDAFLVLIHSSADDTGFADSSTSRLMLVRFISGTAQIVGERSFAGIVSGWESSTDGTKIAISTKEGFLVLDGENGLPIHRKLEGAIAPIAFDSAHNLLLTGSTATKPELVGWNTGNWSVEKSIPISGNRTVSGAESVLTLNATGDQLVATQNESLYLHSIAMAADSKVTISNFDQKQVQIGVRSIGSNSNPVLSDLSALEVDEDGQLKLDPAFVQAKTADADRRLDRLESGRIRRLPAFGQFLRAGRSCDSSL